MTLQTWMINPLNILAEFFLDEFEADPIAVGEWLRSRDIDEEVFIKGIENLEGITRKP